MLLMCLALVVITIPLTTYIVATAAGMEHELPSWYVFVTVWIGMCNPSVNSFMYLVLFKSVRKKTTDMLKEIWQCSCLQ